MKKITIMLVVSGVLLLGLLGCSSKKSMEEKDVIGLNTLKKAQKIEKIDAKSKKVMHTIKKAEDIETFIENLDLDKDEWTIASDTPENLEEKYIYRYYMAPTIKNGEENKKQELEKVLDLVTYGDKNYATLKIEEVSVTFKIPDGAMVYLNR